MAAPAPLSRRLKRELLRFGDDRDALRLRPWVLNEVTAVLAGGVAVTGVLTAEQAADLLAFVPFLPAPLVLGAVAGVVFRRLKATTLTYGAASTARTLVGLVERAERLEPTPARDELLSGLAEAFKTTLGVGAELESATDDEATAAEVARQERALGDAASTFEAAVVSLEAAQEDRRSAFALTSDLSASAAALDALTSSARALAQGSELERDAERQALEEVKVASARAVRTSPRELA
jgi:hypothetical protein